MASVTADVDNYAENATDYYDLNETYDEIEIDLATYKPAIPESLPLSHVYLPVLYFVIFFAGVTGNLFVILVMGSKRKRSGRLVDTFVLNLAAADLVFVFTLPLWAVSASQHHRWSFGDTLCKLSTYVISVNRFSNIFFLTCMSVDRYLAVVRLMDSRFLRSSRCVRLTCAAVWLLSLGLGAPTLAFRGVERHQGESRCVEDEALAACQALNLSTMLLTFLLPVMVILLCYGSILATLRRHCAGNPRAQARRRHSLKIVFTIVTAFVVSWLPFNVFKTASVVSRLAGEELGEEARAALARGLVLSSCLAFLNSCVNPAIYLLLDQHFRRRASSLCLGCLGHGGGQLSYTSNSLSLTGTAESGSTASRTRLHSLSLKG